MSSEAKERFSGDVVGGPSNAELHQFLIDGGAVDIHFIEGGMMDCLVPAELIDHEEVPVEEKWASSLAKQMKGIAEAKGGTGQQQAIGLALIEGESALRIVDGFHRDAAMKMNGVDMVHATVRLMTWDELYDQRIFTAKDHPHVRFSRVVQWMREVWEHSGLSDELSVQQAILLYRFKSSGAKLGLSPETVAKSNEWVARKEKLWDMAAMTIHSHLKIAEDVDPALIHSTREKKHGKALQAPTQSIIKVFSETLPGNFALQNLVMDTAMRENLKSPQVYALCLAVEKSDGVESASEIISKIDWKTWEPVYKKTKASALRRAYDPRYKGDAVLDKASNEITKVRERVEMIGERDDEVTDEMLPMVDAARQRAEGLIAELGKLTAELSELIIVIPEICPSWRSSGVVTRVAIVFALAPGYCVVTTRLGASISGSADTGSTR